MGKKEKARQNLLRMTFLAIEAELPCDSDGDVWAANGLIGAAVWNSRMVARAAAKAEAFAMACCVGCDLRRKCNPLSLADLSDCPNHKALLRKCYVC